MPPIQLSEAEEKSIRQLADSIAQCLKAFRLAELARQETQSKTRAPTSSQSDWDVSDEYDENDPWHLKPKRPRVPKLLLDKREAAGMLGVSTGTLHNLTAPRGDIPVVRLSGRVLYAVSDLQVVIEQHKVRSPSTKSQRE